MSARQRNKGARGELELFRLLSCELGFAVSRNLLQTRDAGCDSLSVPGFVIEVKRQEQPFRAAWMAQAVEAAQSGEIPVVFYRRSRCAWFAYFRAADVLGDPSYSGIVRLEFADAVLFLREHLTTCAEC